MCRIRELIGVVLRVESLGLKNREKRSWLFEGFAIFIRFGELHRHYYGALKKSHWQLLGPALNRDIGASTVGPYVCWLCCGTRSKAGGQRLSSWAGHILPK